MSVLSFNGLNRFESNVFAQYSPLVVYYHAITEKLIILGIFNYDIELYFMDSSHIK